MKMETQTHKLPVVEHFYTIQGEGANTGVAAYFIRLGGCDVGCPWCDAKAAWAGHSHPFVEVDAIVGYVKSTPARAVVITGGEPLMHPLARLTEALSAAGLNIFLETSGTHSFSGTFDWVCLSPKRHKPPLEEAFSRADELKVVIGDLDDISWAEECARRVDSQTRLFLQPEWSVRHNVTPLIVDYVKNHPQWRVSLQTHKFMDIP